MNTHYKQHPYRKRRPRRPRVAPFLFQDIVLIWLLSMIIGVSVLQQCN